MFFPLNFSERRPTINWPSCNASVRRELARKVGGFDEHFARNACDDTEFSWRLHLAGARIVFDPCPASSICRFPAAASDRAASIDSCGVTRTTGRLVLFLAQMLRRPRRVAACLVVRPAFDLSQSGIAAAALVCD